MRNLSTLLFLSSLAWLVSSCDQRVTQSPYDNTLERQAFYPRYNQEVRERTLQEIAAMQREIDSATADATEKKIALDLLIKRRDQGDFFQQRSEAELPSDLDWKTNDADPDIGSPQAKKGGTFHTFLPTMSYPPTIRCLGKEANNGFRAYHHDYIEMGLIATHPDTGRTIPALADRWAISADRQTVYFHINDRARWSDQLKVSSEDFLMSFYVYLSPYLTEPWYRTYYGEQFNGLTTYGDAYLAVRLANPKPRPEMSANLVPFHRNFYREFGPDFEARYNWRPRPTTGAYQIRAEDIIKGESISLSRVKDWWARDLLYYRYVYNPDRIEYRLIRDLEKAFVLFCRGDLDWFPLGQPKYWYEKTEIPAVFRGYIHKATFYNEYPRSPYGLYFNQAVPLLQQQDIRIGLQHATNWQKVIDFDMRGDATRLHIMNDGFGRFSNSHIRTREFSIEQAAAAFARAGFTQKGSDGVWMNSQGQRLSFTISYSKSAFLDQIMQRLKEEALKAGVEYKLEGADGTANFQKISQKKHEIAFAGWNITPPFPDYYEFLHSKDAFEPGSRTPRAMTNNILTYANPEMDQLVERNRNATDEETILETSHRIETLLHEQAAWCPGWKKDYYRLAYWRWLQWPDSFNVRISDEPEMSYVFWIDPSVKEATHSAMRRGEVFEESNRVYDQFRQTNSQHE